VESRGSPQGKLSSGKKEKVFCFESPALCKLPTFEKSNYGLSEVFLNLSARCSVYGGCFSGSLALV